MLPAVGRQNEVVNFLCHDMKVNSDQEHDLANMSVEEVCNQNLTAYVENELLQWLWRLGD